MKPRQLQNLGVPAGEATRLAGRLIGPALAGGVDRRRLADYLRAVVASPGSHLDDPHFGPLARLLESGGAVEAFVPRPTPAPYRQFGEDLDPASVAQMQHACELPVAARGALMPDAHVGYGLPIGGALATEGAVIPYAVGVDIACRMKLSVLDLPTKLLQSEPERLTKAIESETRFGVGAEFRRGRGRGKTGPRDHPVMDEDWSVTKVTEHLKDKAARQLGTSGSGNHFVEFGVLTVDGANAAVLGLPEAGAYLALLSHSGSRGAGAAVASHYSNLAMRRHENLPKHLKHLAWLDLDSAEGQEYWAAMNLMGRYAAANHALVHRHIARHLGAAVLADVENHHNFAWVETHAMPDGTQRDLIVHRKGATPAGEGVLGIIPGSMADPCYVVRGKGDASSLRSASHGAGRVMSRTQARNTFNWKDVQRVLDARGVTVISAGLDEVPMVYKNIDEVMAEQTALVETLARFDPKLVKMAPGGRAED